MLLFVCFTLGSEVLGTRERNLFTGQLSQEDLKAILVGQDDFVFFPKYEDRSFWNNVPRFYREGILSLANSALDYTWPHIEADRILTFFETGDRSAFLSLWAEKRSTLWVLLQAELITGEGRYLRQIINGIWNISEESSWVTPGHMDQFFGESILPDASDHYVDLMAARTGALLAWVSYFLKDELDAISPEINKRIHYEVKRRVHEPAMRFDHWWMSFGDGRQRINNWNTYSNTNWLSSVLILENDPKRRAAAVYRILQSLDRFVNFYPDDGGCDEGPSYWMGAAGILLNGIELLNAATSNSFTGLYEEEIIRNMGTYLYKVYMGNRHIANFADSHRYASPAAGGMAFRYGLAIGNERMKRFGSYLWEDDVNHFTHGSMNFHRLFDLLYHTKITKHPPEEVLLRDTWLPDTQLMTARSKPGSVTGFSIAAKGGHNDESHNHNDVGSFIAYMDGEPLLIDVGVGTYTKRYFGKDRYTVWMNRSEFHNLPTINGYEQSAGPHYRAKDVHYEKAEGWVNFALDIANAYPEETGLTSWNRTISFYRSSSIEITDVYEFKTVPESNYQNLMTTREVSQLEPGLLLLRAENEKDAYLRFSPETLSLVVKRLDLNQPEDGRVVANWGDEIYRIRLRDESPGKSGSYQLRISRNP